MTETVCKGCKKTFTCDEINPKTQKSYKSCESCRRRTFKSPMKPDDWKSVVFGTNADNNDDNASEKQVESTASEIDDANSLCQAQVEQASTPQLTLNQKIDSVLTTLNETSNDIRNTIDGRDTSTKFILEKLHNDLVNLRLLLGNDADQNQFNRYELKIEKLATRMDNMETLLHSKFSDIQHGISKKIDDLKMLI